MYQIQTQPPPKHWPGIAWPVPENASDSVAMSRPQSPSEIRPSVPWAIHGRSRGLTPYTWCATVSKIRVVRPLARYATPICRMNSVGEWEMLLGAAGLSLPLGEVFGAITFTSGRYACRTSQQRASSAT